MPTLHAWRERRGSIRRLKQARPRQTQEPALAHAPKAPQEPAADGKRPGPIKRIRQWLHDNHGKLFWVHSLYALGLGAFVATFASKGLGYARWLVLLLIGAWIMIVAIFRLHGTGSDQKVETAGQKVRYFAMTYVLKNLYQGMLFFLLPFYWKTAVTDGPTLWFLVLLGVTAFLSTMDVIFDNYVMKWRWIASIFYGVTLFACLNVAVPALVSEVPALISCTVAGAVTVLAFCSMHAPLSILKKPLGILAILAFASAGAGVAYFGRAYIPPVPNHVMLANVGPELLADGRLALKVNEIHVSKLSTMYAVTDVVIPGGLGDTLRHVWRKDGDGFELPEVNTEVTSKLFDAKGKVITHLIRLKSKFPEDKLPQDPVGAWTVDVMTDGGQLVGRARFTVME